MDLTLTRRADYAVRAALFLAEAWNPDAPPGGIGYRKVREISSVMDLPLSYTPQILGILVRAGLVEAKAGREGGYRLLRAPSTISLLDVVEAAEGPLAPERCTLRGGPCHWEDFCPVHPAWAAAAQALRASLARASLVEVAATDRAIAGKTFKSATKHRKPRIRSRSDSPRTPAR